MHISHSLEDPPSDPITFDGFLAVDIRVGTIIAAEPFPEARNPALKLVIDFGPVVGRKRSSAQIVRHYRPETLVGRQLAAVVKFRPQQIGRFISEALTLGFPDADGEVVFCAPRRRPLVLDWIIEHGKPRGAPNDHPPDRWRCRRTKRGMASRPARSLERSRTMKHVLISVICAAALGLAASTADAQTLNTVKTRVCLTAARMAESAGFGQPDPQGNWTGLDVVAAAIFDDPTKVKFVALTATDRFTAVQSGEVDLVSRNTTWTLSRDTALGLNFTGVLYYDGQGFIVRKALKVNSALELNDAAVCVAQGTTTELGFPGTGRT